MSSGSVKLEQIVAAARNLFWKHGIRRVTIEEICRESGVSKMTFYKHFRNKVELVKFILDRIKEESLGVYRQIMDQEAPFSEKIRQSIRLKFTQTEQLSEEFFQDIHKYADQEIRDHFNRMIGESIQMIMNDYLEAQHRGDIRSDIKPEFILYFLNHMIDMARDEVLENLYTSPQELIMELTNFFFYGILPR